MLITFELTTQTQNGLRHSVCLVNPRRTVYMLTLLGHLKNLTSGQGQVVTRVGHVAYWATRLDEINTLVPQKLLYLHYVASY